MGDGQSAFGEWVLLHVVEPFGISRYPFEDFSYLTPHSDINEYSIFSAVHMAGCIKCDSLAL